MIITESMHRARKRHKHPCFACRLPILPGDGYRRTVWIGDYVDAHCEHIQCASALTDDMEAYLRSDPCEEGLPEGYLVGGYLDNDDTTPEWREWYARRLAQGSE